MLLLTVVVVGTVLLLAMMVWGGRRLTDEQRRMITYGDPARISNAPPKADVHPTSAEGRHSGG